VDEKKPHIFVAGGTGFAAFHYLLKSQTVAGELKPLLLYGARDRSTAYLHETLEALPCRSRISTEDGSLGTQGMVTALLQEELHRTDFSHDTVIYACGPDPMMEAVCRLTLNRNLTTYLSLETRMACGIGVCNGCAVEVKRGEKTSFERVCHEGPVFDARLLTSFSS
jgi:dihydroorotate dehydrogenase electron transfer subunit